MSELDVTLFRPLAEEYRISMGQYADHLGRSLSALPACDVRVRDFTPTMPAWLARTPLPAGVRLRAARSLAYPLQARAAEGTINHIVDHTYAHLLRALDPRRSVVTVHDLMPLVGWSGAVPGYTYPHYPLLFRLAASWLRRAAALIAVSQNTKRDLVRFLGLEEDRIQVIYNGVNPSLAPLSDGARAESRRSLGLPDESVHVILITGNQGYKNHLTSFQVADVLQRRLARPVQLVWLGGDAGSCAQLSRTVNLRSPVQLLSGLPSDRLRALYNSVDCLLFPSWYEGFGWPPVEAMACGVPVVASTAAAVMEVTGGCAITAAAGDVGGLAEGVQRLLEDEAVRAEYIARGVRNANRFQWSRSAALVRDLYWSTAETLLGSRRSGGVA